MCSFSVNLHLHLIIVLNNEESGSDTVQRDTIGVLKMETTDQVSLFKTSIQLKLVTK